MSSDWEKDLRDCNLPKDLEMYNKAPSIFKAGQRIGWWYREDEEYAKECGDTVEEDIPFMGVVVPGPDIENRSGSMGEFDSEECVVVVTVFPVEKCYPDTDYVAMKRLLNNDDLVKVIVID